MSAADTDVRYERWFAAEARVQLLEEALLIAQEGLRVMIRGGYIEQAISALADSEEHAAATTAPPEPSGQARTVRVTNDEIIVTEDGRERRVEPGGSA